MAAPSGGGDTGPPFVLWRRCPILLLEGRCPAELSSDPSYEHLNQLIEVLLGIGNDQIIALGSALLNNFVYERVRRHGDNEAELTRSQLGGVELCDPSHKRLAQCLQQIGDELDGNVHLQSMLNDSTLQPTQEVFMKVAREIFSDGKFNWGRVVALFYFACRLVIKAIITRIPDIIRTIISWTMSYIQEHVINWIREQGGWEGIRSYFGTPTWQTIGVFLAGVLTTVVVIRKM